MGWVRDRGKIYLRASDYIWSIFYLCISSRKQPDFPNRETEILSGDGGGVDQRAEDA